MKHKKFKKKKQNAFFKNGIFNKKYFVLKHKLKKNSNF